MSGADTLDRISQALAFKSLPEMVFGDNALLLEHAPTNCRLRLCAQEALRACTLNATGQPAEDTPLRVAHAKKWDEIPSVEIAVLETSHDWTWTTAYGGTVECMVCLCCITRSLSHIVVVFVFSLVLFAHIFENSRHDQTVWHSQLFDDVSPVFFFLFYLSFPIDSLPTCTAPQSLLPRRMHLFPLHLVNLFHQTQIPSTLHY
jgi:hypothetical protein